MCDLVCVCVSLGKCGGGRLLDLWMEEQNVAVIFVSYSIADYSGVGIGAFGALWTPHLFSTAHIISFKFTAKSNLLPKWHYLSLRHC